MSKRKEAGSLTITAPIERRLLTRAEAARFLAVSQATMSRWAADRTGPAFIKLHDGDAGSVRYPSDLLDAFIESRIKQPKE